MKTGPKTRRVARTRRGKMTGIPMIAGRLITLKNVLSLKVNGTEVRTQKVRIHMPNNQLNHTELMQFRWNTREAGRQFAEALGLTS